MTAFDSQRHIVHLDLDAFFVSVECLRNPKFKGIPLLVGGSSDRGVVASASYEARRFGIHSAMPMKIARRLCPHAVIIGGDYESYSHYSHLVTEIIASKVPVYEKSSIDEFYVDITGMDKFFGCSKYTTDLKKYIFKESGLTISYALASNKLLGKVGTNEVKPDGQIEIPFGTEKNYLAPLTVEKMPGIGAKTGMLLRDMGVETIRILSEIPVLLLQNLLGKGGTELWKRANGIDETPVIPYSEQKSISTENTFQTDTIDVHFLEAELIRMVEKTGFELRNQHRLTGCITLKLRYSNFDTVTKQCMLPYTNNDAVLIDKAKSLFTKLYDKRLLVRLLGIRFSHLVTGAYQISLFDDTVETIQLYQAIDHIKRRFGSGLLMRAMGVPKPEQSKKEAACI
jgi:DNA polymerase-4